MNEPIEQILLDKYRNGTLAALYSAHYDSAKCNPEVWVDNFVKNFTPIVDHPDVLKMRKGETDKKKDKDYKVDSTAIKDFLKFINYRPIALKKKFIFLFNANDLSVIVSNKLLKIFEELSSDFCLILLVPDNAQLLATVESRSIKITLKAQDQFEDVNLDMPKISSPLELSAFIKESKMDTSGLEKKFIEQSIEHCLKKRDFRSCEELLATLKNYQTATAFNNSQLSRLTPFFP